MRGDGARELLDLSNLARVAGEAWQRVQDWGSPPEAEAGFTSETLAFGRWAATFRARLAERGWITSAQLGRWAATALEKGELEAPPELLFAGFERTWPGLELLIAALRGAGTSLLGEIRDQADAGADLPRVAVRVYPTRLDELRGVAQELRRHLESRPASQLGVIAADLSSYRDVLERVLSEELYPASATLAGLAGPRRFDLAGAPALSDYPLVAHALDLLGLGPGGNDFSVVSRVLLAPYPRLADGGEYPQVAGGGTAASNAEAEYEARARAETRLRRENAGRVSLARLAGVLGECQGEAVAERFEALHRFHEGEKEAAAPSEWASGFARALRIMGWPGGRLSEEEGVALSKWREVMGEFATLELVAPRMTGPEALGRVRELAATTLVQAPSGGLTVQVMGVLDGAGLSFDRLWLVGFEDRAFPRPPAPNPLLPVAWQVARGMPMASAASELEFAKRLWRRLLGSAPELGASYAQQGEREETLQPSPFLFDHAAKGESCGRLATDSLEPATEGAAVGIEEPWYRVLAGPREELLTARAREPASRAELMWGGTALIKDQSECPFRALAARRLGVEALAVPLSTPTAADLGRLVHRALGEAWAELGDSRTLRGLADAAVGEVARRAAGAALEQRRILVPASMRAVALDWLADIVAAWLLYERDQRLGGWTVLGHEIEASLELGGSGLRLDPIRIDRVDRLEDGRVMVVDYKASSSEKTAKEWEGERPSDPQLPLYALALQAGNIDVAGSPTPGAAASRSAGGFEVAAVAFANLVSRNRLSLKGPPGVALLEGKAPPQKEAEPSWAELLVSWKRRLDAIADAYVSGQAEVDPLRPPQSCEYCGRQPLCRIFELDARDAEAEAEAEAL